MNGTGIKSMDKPGEWLRCGLAWLYDWLAAWSILACVVWEELILRRLLSIHPGAHADYLVGWGEELARHARESGLFPWRQAVAANLPWAVETVAVGALAAFSALLLHRMLRVTPGEWMFSVRRPPHARPTDGFFRKILRAAVGLAAFAGCAVAWGVLDVFLLNPP